MDQGVWSGPRGDAAARAGAVPIPVSLRSLLAAAALLPLAFLGGAAWFDWQRLNEEGEAHVNRLSAIVREHALKVVETNAIVLDRLEDRIHGLDWPEIEADAEAIQRDLARIDAPIDQITALHLVRPDGTVVVLSTTFPTPPFDLRERAYFRLLQAGATGLVFGDPAIARGSSVVHFTVSRRRGDPATPFDGALVGAILPSYFHAHWKELAAGRPVTISLIREDGKVLAMYPSAEGDLQLPEDPRGSPRPALGADHHPVIAKTGSRGEWLAAYRRVGDQPLLISVTLSRNAMFRQWLMNSMLTATFALGVALALGTVTMMAIRRWRSEQDTLARYSRAAEELRAEIARREAAEADLLQAQRLEALGRLTGGIAHDFNNLLTAILGTVQLLDRHLGTAADERTGRLLGIARDAVDRGARLNASLLAFARRQKLHAAALDANALVRGFLPLLKGALGEAITLTLDLEQALPPCQADPAQLEAALLNLAINARDAMPGGAGHCILATCRVHLTAADLAGNIEAQPGDYVSIAFSDSGAGMSREVRERAFEPFFTTKSIGRGTGLGLSQVFGFVRQLGGHVEIRSAPGRGTTVTLHLPVAQAAAAAETAAASPPRDAAAMALTGLAVLVAEDDSRVREVMVETLRGAGMRVLAAADGQEALALLRRGEAVDLLFSDIVMPGGLSGVELARAARRLNPELPVLLATGYAGTIAGSQDHGFEVLAKPYDQEMVLQRLAALAKTRQRARA